MSEYTLGRTKSALNFEKTRNISFALRAVPSLSRRRAIIWFSTRATRSLYAFSAATQISLPSTGTLTDLTEEGIQLLAC